MDTTDDPSRMAMPPFAPGSTAMETVEGLGFGILAIHDLGSDHAKLFAYVPGVKNVLRNQPLSMRCLFNLALPFPHQRLHPFVKGPADKVLNMNGVYAERMSDRNLKRQFDPVKV
jgi:hypothetical protein